MLHKYYNIVVKQNTIVSKAKKKKKTDSKVYWWLLTHYKYFGVFTDFVCTGTVKKLVKDASLFIEHFFLCPISISCFILLKFKLLL